MVSVSIENELDCVDTTRADAHEDITGKSGKIVTEDDAEIVR